MNLLAILTTIERFASLAAKLKSQGREDATAEEIKAATAAMDAADADLDDALREAEDQQ